MLILICGLPGTGKTYLSGKLSKKANIVHLSSDSIRRKTIKERTYSEEEKAKIYNLMRKEAADLTRNGKDVVLDATFYQERYRQMFYDLASEKESIIKTIRCSLDEESVRRRLKERGRKESQSEADYEVYKQLKDSFEPIKRNHLILDMSLPDETLLREVMEYIEK